MSLMTYKLIALIAILFISLISVIYPIKMRARPEHHPLLEWADAFASGIFLGAALFHMLPEATELFTDQLPSIHYPLAEAFCAIGFLLLLFLERLAACGKEPQALQKSSRQNHGIPCILAFILIIHALIEGAALGISTTAAATSILFLAIIAHKSSESFALAVILNRSHFKLPTIIFIICVFSAMTPIGILGGSLLSLHIASTTGKLLMAGFNAFAAGTFLYMSTLHHINHHQQHHEKENLTEFFFLIIGLLIMAVIAFWK